MSFCARLAGSRRAASAPRRGCPARPRRRRPSRRRARPNSFEGASPSESANDMAFVDRRATFGRSASSGRMFAVCSVSAPSDSASGIPGAQQRRHLARERGDLDLHDAPENDLRDRPFSTGRRASRSAPSPLAALRQLEARERSTPSLRSLWRSGFVTRRSRTPLTDLPFVADLFVRVHRHHPVTLPRNSFDAGSSFLASADKIRSAHLGHYSPVISMTSSDRHALDHLARRRAASATIPASNRRAPDRTGIGLRERQPANVIADHQQLVDAGQA